MIAAQHTPGPWEACGAMVRTRFIHGDPEQRGSLIAECAMGGMPAGENARLIAVAPELLDASAEAAGCLSACIDMLRHAGHPKTAELAQKYHDQLVAVIAKASGTPA